MLLWMYYLVVLVGVLLSIIAQRLWTWYVFVLGGLEYYCTTDLEDVVVVVLKYYCTTALELVRLWTWGSRVLLYNDFGRWTLMLRLVTLVDRAVIGRSLNVVPVYYLLSIFLYTKIGFCLSQDRVSNEHLPWPISRRIKRQQKVGSWSTMIYLWLSPQNIRTKKRTQRRAHSRVICRKLRINHNLSTRGLQGMLHIEA